MNSKTIKGIAGVGLLVAAVISGMASGPSKAPKAEVEKDKAGNGVGLGKLMITHPSEPKFYAPGTYVFEGQVGKGKRVAVLLDSNKSVPMDADADGAFRYEAQIKEEGKHRLKLTISGEDKQESETKTLEFQVDKSNQVETIAHAPTKSSDEPEKGARVVKKDDNDLPVDLLPEDDQSNVVYPDSGKFGSDNVPEKDHPVVISKEPTNTKKKPPVNKPPVKKPPVKEPVKPVKAVKAGAKFVISSHSNFNVVPHGIIKIGGKGNAGDKVMLLIDGKPAMRGTIKPDGRWAFPVKVSNPGFRKISAQNLRSREKAVLKLKIK